MRIVWDEPKRQSNIAKHGYDFADLFPEFFEEALSLPSYANRKRLIGKFGNHLIAAVIRPLGAEAISIISMREANRKEIELYEQATSKLRDG